MTSWKGQGSASFKDALNDGPAHQALQQASGLAGAAQLISGQLDEVVRGLPPGIDALGGKMRALLGVFKEKLDNASFSALTDSITELVRAINAKDQNVVAVEQEVAALKQKVADLERVIAEFAEQRQDVLGGQLACNLDDIVCQAVLGPGTSMNLNKLNKYVEEFHDDADLQQRWRSAVRFLETNAGMPLHRLIAALRPLRQQRYTAAHGTAEEQEVTAADLRRWGDTQSTYVKAAVQLVLPILQPLTFPDKPLRPLNPDDVDKVIFKEA
ncbi:hypothetical protein TSOC_005797 [Tetrabaena socialis]|uniref:Uncharacterized protein n=1 Tax=Tetrabaena socialis TaxID=47790 RepID=A0A2J8A5D0_9CHLO|nr:hypothetical protein TSOC_005795 [Tetrabaena socialis]PNH07724.1 hypothetical protein TSOC_005797 [Tetrabaena socialis]|eukprot:PNH07722.1 hypothetical protein TSOC_005795 [Tetrabaena socialis]